MTAGGYRAEVIDWVRRTTAAQGVPEHVPVEVFQTRLAALFGATTTTRDAGADTGRSESTVLPPAA
ncbi:hypothetical protein GCM10028798_16230 [Humibacter antri]